MGTEGRHVPLDRETAARGYDCPHCGRPAGQGCRTEWGSPRYAHKKRVDLIRPEVATAEPEESTG